MLGFFYAMAYMVLTNPELLMFEHKQLITRSSVQWDCHKQLISYLLYMAEGVWAALASTIMFSMKYGIHLPIITGLSSVARGPI